VLTKEPDKAKGYFEQAVSSKLHSLSAYRGSQFELGRFD